MHMIKIIFFNELLFQLFHIINKKYYRKFFGIIDCQRFLFCETKYYYFSFLYLYTFFIYFFLFNESYL